MAQQTIIPIEDLCEELSKECGIPPVTLKYLSRKIFAKIQEALKQQTPVVIPEFGRFDFRYRKERINSNISGDIPTYTPANSTVHFSPDRKWAWWQMTHSAKLPDTLPPGTQLGIRFVNSHCIREQLGDDAPPMVLSEKGRAFYENVIKPSAINKARKRLLSSQLSEQDEQDD